MGSLHMEFRGKVTETMHGNIEVSGSGDFSGDGQNESIGSYAPMFAGRLAYIAGDRHEGHYSKD